MSLRGWGSNYWRPVIGPPSRIRALVEGGESGIFTPMFFFLARKLCDGEAVSQGGGSTGNPRGSSFSR